METVLLIVKVDSKASGAPVYLAQKPSRNLVVMTSKRENALAVTQEEGEAYLPVVRQTWPEAALAEN